MRDIHRVRGGDTGSLRASRGEGVRAVAAQYARQLPEGLGDDAHADARSGARVKRMVIVGGHAGHHQRALRA